jgi:methylthioribose-1-phosphate isomerase
MEVRGAPLIGGTAAYGIVLAIQESTEKEFINKSAEELIQSRPTAINLKWAVDRMMSKLSGINSDQIFKYSFKGSQRNM